MFGVLMCLDILVALGLDFLCVLISCCFLVSGWCLRVLCFVLMFNLCFGCYFVWWFDLPTLALWLLWVLLFGDVGQLNAFGCCVIAGFLWVNLCFWFG